MRNYATETMTCVEWYIGDSLKIANNPFQYAVYRNGLENTLYVTVNWYNVNTSGSLADLLQCTLNGQRYSFTSMNGWEDPVCVLPYTPNSTTDKYAIVSKSTSYKLTYQGSNRSEYVMTPGRYTTLPVLTMPEFIIYGNASHSLKWTLTPGDGRRGWGFSLELWYREPGADTYVSEVMFTDSFRSSYTMKTDGNIVGKEACVVLEYRTYDSSWNGNNVDDFTTMNRMVTPWQMVERDATVPLAPESISTSMLLAGGKVTVQWPAVADPMLAISAYRLERAVVNANGVSGSFVQLYKGTSTQFQDTLPENTNKVLYRVCSVSQSGKESSWTVTGMLEVAQSNLYVSRGGTWVRAAGVWIGEKRASPMLTVGRK